MAGSAKLKKTLIPWSSLPISSSMKKKALDAHLLIHLPYLVNYDDIHFPTSNKLMSQYNITEAQAQLSKLTRRALAGEEVIIAHDNKPLVQLIPVRTPKRTRQPGSGKGQLLRMAPDFDVIPTGFEDYT